VSACLDSWTILAWLDGDDPAAGRVETLLGNRPIMSWVNAVEVYYRVERDHGREAADEVLAELRVALELELPGVSRMIETGRLKAKHPIALGDCFAIATAAGHRLPLVTGDPDILAQEGLPCVVEDARTK
jgi:uncharacterized protein with PIN domain